ncbi:MAG: hypothetical protein BJ554DRAFT_5631, partial [Olpidium bornovanus]
MVYLLRKALYGLRQSARCWNTDLDTTLRQHGFVPVRTEPCLYYLQANDGIYLVQRHYAEKVLEKFNHLSCHAEAIPLNPSAISSLAPRDDVAPAAKKAQYSKFLGSLNYLSICTRPDIASAQWAVLRVRIAVDTGGRGTAESSSCCYRGSLRRGLRRAPLAPQYRPPTPGAANRPLGGALQSQAVGASRLKAPQEAASAFEGCYVAFIFCCFVLFGWSCVWGGNKRGGSLLMGQVHNSPGHYLPDSRPLAAFPTC